MVHRFIRSAEVERENEFLGTRSLCCVLATRSWEVATILDLLHQPADAVFDRAPRSEPNLLGWDEVSLFRDEGEPSQDHSLDELTHITRERNGMITGHQPLILA